MILTPDQIKNIILTNPNNYLVVKAQLYNKELRTHIYGEHLSGKITTIEGFEKEGLKELRAKYAKSNKDVFGRLGRPIDKVFSAKGTSIYYNLSGTSEKKAIELASDVRDGYSAKKWMERYWKPHFCDDPCGFIFIEIDKQAKAYPTYKSISSVYDYQPKGTGLEYVVFNVTKSEKIANGFNEDDLIYRVVDDVKDYWVTMKNNDVSIIENNTFDNYFGKVPAIINSDIASSHVDGMFLSLYDDIIELANHFLLKGSIKVTHDFLHGFPKYYEYADDCVPCGGSGKAAGENCSDCKGTGKKIMTKVSDVKILAYPDKDNPEVSTPGGYIEPSQTYYDIATAELADLENAMTFTLWGTEGRKTVQQPGQAQGSDKTATQVIDEIQPKADRLTSISEMAEKRHKFILDHIIGWELQRNYVGASVSYGRRYMIESPDSIWDRYQKARSTSSPDILDDMLLDYIETKYSSDPVGMNVQKKLMQVQPFVHRTPSEVSASMFVSEDDKKQKEYYSEWVKGLTDIEILNTPIESLVTKLKEFAATKTVVIIPKTAAAPFN
jgi:hypothetical protein